MAECSAVAEIVADLMGAHRNNMEKLYYQKTTILMAECKHIYQKPLFLVADLGKPTSFGAQQRGSAALYLVDNVVSHETSMCDAVSSGLLQAVQ